MELYVIRHGQTIVNVMNRINSINCIGINRNGRKEAKYAALEVEKLKLDLIFCSPLIRTRQTCKIINKNNVKVIYEERIMERNARSMQFRKITELDVLEWYNLDKEVIYKDAEGFKSVLQRVENFLNEIKEKYPDKSILLVTHGDVCRAINVYLNNISDACQIGLFEHANCEIKKYII